MGCEINEFVFSLTVIPTPLNPAVDAFVGFVAVKKGEAIQKHHNFIHIEAFHIKKSPYKVPFE